MSEYTSINSPDPNMVKLLQEKNAIIAELKRRNVEMQNSAYFHKMQISKLENHIREQSKTLAHVDRVLGSMQLQAKQWKKKAVECEMQREFERYERAEL